MPSTHFAWSDYQVLILDYNLQDKDETGLDILVKNKNNGLFPVTVMLTGEAMKKSRSAR